MLFCPTFCAKLQKLFSATSMALTQILMDFQSISVIFQPLSFIFTHFHFQPLFRHFDAINNAEFIDNRKVTENNTEGLHQNRIAIRQQFSQNRVLQCLSAVGISFARFNCMEKRKEIASWGLMQIAKSTGWVKIASKTKE